MAKVRLLGVLFVLPLLAQSPIDQQQGADQRVDYAALVRLGPWDDRNYQLTLEDLALLAPNEQELRDPIPAFFRVYLRRTMPDLPQSGAPQYPRAAVPLFYRLYGGLMRFGSVEGRSKSGPPTNTEITLNSLLGANEVTVEINPAMPMQAIAGANNVGGQEMYYSGDGGSTWFSAGLLPATCCDPTVAWSSDGSLAYAASLATGLIVSVYRSSDAGQTWSPALPVSPGGSDKEWLHVDLSPDSPHRDNVYLTYHRGNIMQFARSSDRAASFTTTSFVTAPEGLGSDLTTDGAGSIYYFYPTYEIPGIILLKSSDGGLSFDPPLTLATTQASYDWPIPAMETRRAWVYLAADSDRSGGPFDGSIYAAWTDTLGPESTLPAENHARIQVAGSRDGGLTWTVTTPHETADVLTVDRFNQWLVVDQDGVVHVVFYDTRHSLNRGGTDLYYSSSNDGAITWSTPQRISLETSANITDFQEWGDYNGISVVGDRIIPVWTDNRDGPPNRRNVLATTAEVGLLDCLFSDLSVDAGEDRVACQPHMLQANVDGGSGPYSFSWSPAELLDDPTSETPLATHIEPTVFCLQVTDAAGCKREASVLITPQSFAVSAFPTGAQGLDAMVLEAEISCLNGQTLWQWQNLSTQEVFGANENPVQLATLLGETTRFSLSASNSGVVEETTLVVLVSPNNAFFDLNGDGCNDLLDLHHVLPNWRLETPNDGDGNGIMDVRDYLYISTRQISPCRRP